MEMRLSGLTPVYDDATDEEARFLAELGARLSFRVWGWPPDGRLRDVVQVTTLRPSGEASHFLGSNWQCAGIPSTSEVHLKVIPTPARNTLLIQSEKVPLDSAAMVITRPVYCTVAI